MEHQVGVVNGYSPLLLDIGLRSHPCEPVGSCDFEDGFCSFQSNFWYRYTLKFFNQRRHSRFPVIDHTYGAPEGKDIFINFFRYFFSLVKPLLIFSSSLFSLSIITLNCIAIPVSHRAEFAFLYILYDCYHLLFFPPMHLINLIRTVL